MVREPNIPLFLWIATAILVHILFAGGADHASRLVAAGLDLRRFAASVQNYVRASGGPVEVTLLEEDERELEADEEKSESEESEQLQDERLAQADPTLEPRSPQAQLLEPEQPAPLEPEQRKPDESARKKAEQKPDEPPVQTLELQRDRRIAVRQHVQDKNQPDNPDAEFIGDEANRVEQQTQARITSTDQNDPNPTPGGHHLGPTDEPGNADETAPGEPDRTPTPLPTTEQPRVASVAPVPRPQPQARAPGREAPRQPQPPGRPERKAQASKPATQATPDHLTFPDGSFSVTDKRVAEAARRERRERKKRLPPRRRRPDDLLGLGASGLTENGVNLNLSPQSAISAIGRDQLVRERQADGERRRSAHRGSWRTLGIERWRSAIENYVAHVKPGNQTALNTARVPFASYLNAVHNRIHPVFADTFLVSLNSLPSNHPLNQMDISTHLEIVLSSVDGRLVDMGVTKTSGVTAFDIGALESVLRASPFGPPPRQIISPDGNVYFHWEFHRNPYYACSTYFARPYILKTRPQPRPPSIVPPTRNPFRPREEPPSEHRHGRIAPDPGRTHALGQTSPGTVHRSVFSG
jgi:hypothetical protein